MASSASFFSASSSGGICGAAAVSIGGSPRASSRARATSSIPGSGNVASAFGLAMCQPDSMNSPLPESSTAGAPGVSQK